MTHSPNNQTITFYGSNLANTRVVYVTFPNGGHALLQGYQQIAAQWNTINLTMTLATPGKWQITIVGTNGAASNTYTFNVQ